MLDELCDAWRLGSVERFSASSHLCFVSLEHSPERRVVDQGSRAQAGAGAAQAGAVWSEHTAPATASRAADGAPRTPVCRRRACDVLKGGDNVRLLRYELFKFAVEQNRLASTPAQSCDGYCVDKAILEFYAALLTEAACFEGVESLERPQRRIYSLFVFSFLVLNFVRDRLRF